MVKHFGLECSGKTDLQEHCEIMNTVERLTGKTLTVSLLEANLLEESEE